MADQLQQGEQAHTTTTRSDTEPMRQPPAALAATEEALLATLPIPVERHEVMVNGMRLHYLTCGEGEGEPLLLLHGRGSAAALFAPILPQLAAQRRVIALDLPGWGLSDKPPFQGHTAQDALNIWMGGALGLLDALGLDRVDVLGHSMGGFTALGLALDHPDRVHRLLLVDSGGLGRNAQFDVRLYFWLKPERLNRLFGPKFLRYALRRDNPHGMATSGPLFDFLYAVMSQTSVIASGGRAFDAWVDIGGVHMNFLDRLKELETPTLLLWGERDIIVRYSDALVATRHMPHARLVAFTGCGHSPFWERPDDFARVAQVWLNGGGAPSRV
ncbi:MAG: alpha/beta fold hydrolase [Ktedonobacterales bacterium]